jgi:hypothetical protein
MSTSPDDPGKIDLGEVVELRADRIEIVGGQAQISGTVRIGSPSPGADAIEVGEIVIVNDDPGEIELGGVEEE